MSGSNIRYRARNTFAARFEVLHDGGVVGELYPYDAPEVQCVSASALKMSMKGVFLRPTFAVDWLHDRIRAIIQLNGVDYNAGIYLPITPIMQKNDGVELVEIEGYSLLYLAQRTKTEGIYHIDAGTNYIAAINALLLGAGLTNYGGDETAAVMATAREDWDEGTPYIEIINQLLSEIGYNSAWVDLQGKVWLTKYVDPGQDDVDHTYRADGESIITADYSYSDDAFDKANVFKLYCQNPEFEEPLSATAVNDDAASPFSTVSLGARVLYVESVDNVPDQATLQARADEMMRKSKYRTETVEFTTAIAPGHKTFDTLAIDNGEITGLYRETEWRMELTAGGYMTHKAERVSI